MVFPPTASGSGLTSSLGRAVVADALRGVDPVGARAAEGETDWRRAYLVHFRRLVEAGLSSGEAARRIATDGLASLHDRMRYVAPGAATVPLREVFGVDAAGAARHGDRRRPRAGRARVSPAVPRRAPAPATPSTAGSTRGSRPASSSRPAPRRSARSRPTPTGSTSAGTRVVALGAGAEMGPVRALLRWGDDVLAVDLPRPPLWARLLETAGGTAVGCACRSRRRPTAPTRRPSGPAPTCCTTCPPSRTGSRRTTGRWSSATTSTPTAPPTCASRRPSTRSPSTCAGPGRTPRSRCWPRRPTSSRCPARRSTRPTAAYAAPSGFRRVRGPLRLVSGGRLLRRNYAPGIDPPGICDSPGGAAGAELRPRQAGAALAGHRRPGGRRHRQPQGRPADPYPLGRDATARSPPPTPARTGSVSRCSSRRPATRSWRRCSSTTSATRRGRRSTSGRRRRRAPRTAVSGGRRTPRAAPSVWPPSSVSAAPARSAHRATGRACRGRGVWMSLSAHPIGCTHTRSGVRP